MESKNKSTGIIVAIIAVLVVVGGIFWAMNMDDSNNNTQTTSQSQQDDQNQQPGNIVVIASETPDLSTLVTAVKAANLVDTLQSEGPFTVFAPTNEAFEALPEGTLDSLLKPENVDQLKSVLTYHVVQGNVLASDLKDGQEITTVQGGKLKVMVKDSGVSLMDAKGNEVMVEKADVNADNGVVHIISGVLLPS